MGAEFARQSEATHCRSSKVSGEKRVGPQSAATRLLLKFTGWEQRLSEEGVSVGTQSPLINARRPPTSRRVQCKSAGCLKIPALRLRNKAATPSEIFSNPLAPLPILEHFMGTFLKIEGGGSRGHNLHELHFETHYRALSE